MLPNQPGFDWSKVAALPGVTAMGLFAVYYGGSVEGMDGVDIGFPPANAGVGQTVERPVILAGRMDNQSRVDEVVASPHFMTAHHLRVGDTLTLHLSIARPGRRRHRREPDPPAGPRVKVRIVGVVRSPFFIDSPGDSGGMLPTYALFTRYRADIVGPGEQPPDLHQRPDPAGRRRGGDPRLPRRPRPGDGTLRHRRVGQLRLVRRPGQAG